MNLYGIQGGTPGNPITIDGQGSELIGSDPVSPEGWMLDEKTGVYQRSDLRVIRRFFLVMDGAAIFPSKEAPANLPPGQWCEAGGVIYFRPPAGKTPGDMAIEATVRINGIQIAGETTEIVIRNFNARYFANDGYNIHGNARAVAFHHCNARDMGDEGFSAHGTTETLLDGAIYENCDNGVFNVNTGGRTITRNIVVRAARRMGFGIHPRDGEAEHTVENAILIDCPVGLGLGKNTVVTNAIILSDLPAGTAIAMDHGGRLERVGVSGRAMEPLQIKEAGFFDLSRVCFNSARPIRIKTEKPLAEVIRFDACSAASGLGLKSGSKPVGPASEWISQEFPLVSTAEFLDGLLAGKPHGPSPELVRKAIQELRRGEKGDR